MVDQRALEVAAKALAKAMMENQPIMTCYNNVVWHVPSLELARATVNAYQNAAQVAEEAHQQPLGDQSGAQ